MYRMVSIFCCLEIYFENTEISTSSTFLQKVKVVLLLIVRASPLLRAEVSDVVEKIRISNTFDSCFNMVSLHLCVLCECVVWFCLCAIETRLTYTNKTKVKVNNANHTRALGGCLVETTKMFLNF